MGFRKWLRCFHRGRLRRVLVTEERGSEYYISKSAQVHVCVDLKGPASCGRIVAGAQVLQGTVLICRFGMFLWLLGDRR